MQNKPILTKREVADLLSVSIRTIERWEASGEIPHGRRIGGQVRWLRSAIIRMLFEGEATNHDIRPD